MHSPNVTQENIARLAELFPHCITEKKVDFDLLKQTLSDAVKINVEQLFKQLLPSTKVRVI